MSKTFDQQEKGTARPGKTSYGDPRAIDGSTRSSPDSPRHDAPRSKPAPRSEKPLNLSGPISKPDPRPKKSPYLSGSSPREQSKAAGKDSRPKTSLPRRVGAVGKRDKRSQAMSLKIAQWRMEDATGPELTGDERGQVYPKFEEAKAAAIALAKKTGVPVRVRKDSSRADVWRID